MKDYRLYAFIGLIFTVVGLVLFATFMFALDLDGAGASTLGISVTLSLLLGGLPNFLINGKIF